MERKNLSIRTHLKRFQRKTIGFSYNVPLNSDHELSLKKRINFNS
nr:IS1 family transposase [Cruoricaptor ignavus]